MDGLLTIKPDFNSYWWDMHMKYTNKSNMMHKQQKKPDRTFRINPAWNRAFSGREEYNEN